MARFGSLGQQYFDDNGDPLINGLIKFYESGTTTDKNTYTDANLTIPNTNPVVLTAAGRQPNIFFNGTARAILYTSAGEQIEVLDPVGGEDTAGEWSSWDSVTVYGVNDIVEGTDGRFYLSLVSSNQGNDPTSSPASWTALNFVHDWNTNQTYNSNDVVKASDGVIYTSKVASNSGNDPTSSPVQWRDLVPASLSDKTLTDTIFQGSFEEEQYTLTGTALDPANGTIQTKVLSGAVALSDSLTNGESLLLHIENGSTHAVTWPVTTWVGGSAPTLTAHDAVEFWKKGGTLYAAYVGSLA